MGETGTMLEVVSGMNSFSVVTGGKAGYVDTVLLGRHGGSLKVPSDGQKWGRRKAITQDRGRQCSELQSACLAGLRAHLKFVAMNLKW